MIRLGLFRDNSKSYEIENNNQNKLRKEFPKSIRHSNAKTKTSQADKRIHHLLTSRCGGDLTWLPTIKTLALYDPTPNKKYLGWLLGHRLKSWDPTPQDLKRVGSFLKLHYRGAKYFSPLSWTGLRLEDVGYSADIFQYSPETLLGMKPEVKEIIDRDEEDKQIRKGKFVNTPGAEVAYQDRDWTVVRIRSNTALRRLCQGSSWCVRHGIGPYHGILRYNFPFDLILNADGDRYLANLNQIKDRWDHQPPQAIYEQITRIRRKASDSVDRASLLLSQAISNGIRLSALEERDILKHPQSAVSYAVKVIRAPWREFDETISLRNLSPEEVADYAIHCKKSRWESAESVIKKSLNPLARYCLAFPSAIPMLAEKLGGVPIKLLAWRSETKGLSIKPRNGSVQAMAESTVREIDYELWLLDERRTTLIRKYMKLVRSLSAEGVARCYVEKYRSYFQHSEDPDIQEANDRITELRRNTSKRRARASLPPSVPIAWR